MPPSVLPDHRLLNDDAGLHANGRRTATAMGVCPIHPIGLPTLQGMFQNQDCAQLSLVVCVGRAGSWELGRAACCAAGLHGLTCICQKKLSSPSLPTACLTLTLTTLR
jgi:hypothetical protein